MKTIKTLIAVVALSGTVSATVQAADVTVKKGDTISKLSQVHNAAVYNMEKMHHPTTDLIYPGVNLTILPEKHYMVKQGDTLLKIAEEKKVSVRALIKWNQLITDLIYPGLSLVFYEQDNPNNEIKAAINKQSTQKVIKPINTNRAEKTSPPLKPAVVQKKVIQSTNSTVKSISVKATAYTASCQGCSGKTKTGLDLKANPEAKVISVDPSVIPLGSKVYVEGYGYATAADTGSAIKGKRIDVFIPSLDKAKNFGSKQLTVKIIN